MRRTPPLFAIAALLAAGLSTPAAAQATEPYIGEIMMTGYTFCPVNWAEADGRLLLIANYAALFSLYGTTYGGDGRTTFALPDLRGRAALDQGSASGQPSYVQGQKGGATDVTLTVTQMPSHSHLNMATTWHPIPVRRTTRYSEPLPPARKATPAVPPRCSSNPR
jgi:microcystin-dependent protein